MGLLFLIGLGAVGVGYAVSSAKHRRPAARPNPNPPPGVMADGSPCTCACHSTGIIHIGPCCDAWGGGDAPAARQLPSFSPSRGHYGHYDASGNYRRE